MKGPKRVKIVPGRRHPHWGEAGPDLTDPGPDTTTIAVPVRHRIGDTPVTEEQLIARLKDRVVATIGETYGHHHTTRRRAS